MVKNIILQHMTGDLRELDKLSIDNIQKYANKIGADYRLLRGNVFSEKYRPAIQKVYMIHQEFDEYDNVLMLDIDMFTRKGMHDNVFKESGIGLYSNVQKELHKRLAKSHKKLVSIDYPYWGGAIYKFAREHRIHLRKGLDGDQSWIDTFKRQGYYGDEGVMATLATKTQFKPTNPYFPDNKWCCCSFLPEVEKAGFIHIRTKIKPGGPKQEKIKNYQALVNNGIIE